MSDTGKSKRRQQVNRQSDGARRNARDSRLTRGCWRLHRALGSSRSGRTAGAVGLCAEVGDFDRFDKAGRLMSYLGLVPSENSSGETRRQGAITKTGSASAKRRSASRP